MIVFSSLLMSCSLSGWVLEDSLDAAVCMSTGSWLSVVDAAVDVDMGVWTLGTGVTVTTGTTCGTVLVSGWTLTD